MESARQEIDKLRNKIAVFNSESGLYLKLVLGFLAALVAGMIINSFLSLYQAGETARITIMVKRHF